MCTHKPTHTWSVRKIQKWKFPHWYYSWTKGHGMGAAATPAGVKIILILSVFENDSLTFQSEDIVRTNECLYTQR